MADVKSLISYVAYYVSRGKAVIAPLGEYLRFQGLVYQYRGYHSEFQSFWQQLRQRHDFKHLYLEGDAYTFEHLLQNQWTIGECARCDLPIPIPVGSALEVPACLLCDREALPPSAPHQCFWLSPHHPPNSTDASAVDASAVDASMVQQLEYNFNLSHVVVIEAFPETKTLTPTLALNGFQVSFVATPEAAVALAKDHLIDLILIAAGISEQEGSLWADKLRREAALQHTPIVGFSPEAGEGIPWLERPLKITDYLLVPLGGQHLIGQLQKLLQQPNWAKSEIYWFPCLSNQPPTLPEQGTADNSHLASLLVERTLALEISQQQQTTLKLQVQDLENLHRRKDDFLNTVSHELRTPMTNIRMATRMLELAMLRAGILTPNPTEASAETSKVAHYLQILKLECEREISLINELLDLQRLEADLQPWLLETIQLQTWLTQVVEPFQERAQQRQQKLQVMVAAPLPPLSTDGSSLERILDELLNNACKYTPAQAEITVKACIISDRLQLSVSNSGIEIAPEQLPHIFDKFYRIPKHDFWKEGGTGLGLALVQKLVERLGGRITVVSSQQQTEFMVELPLKLLPSPAQS